MLSNNNNNNYRCWYLAPLLCHLNTGFSNSLSILSLAPRTTKHIVSAKSIYLLAAKTDLSQMLSIKQVTLTVMVYYICSCGFAYCVKMQCVCVGWGEKRGGVNVFLTISVWVSVVKMAEQKDSALLCSCKFVEGPKTYKSESAVQIRGCTVFRRQRDAAETHCLFVCSSKERVATCKVYL